MSCTSRQTCIIHYCYKSRLQIRSKVLGTLAIQPRMLFYLCTPGESSSRSGRPSSRVAWFHRYRRGFFFFFSNPSLDRVRVEILLHPYHPTGLVVILCCTHWPSSGCTRWPPSAPAGEVLLRSRASWARSIVSPRSMRATKFKSG